MLERALERRLPGRHAALQEVGVGEPAQRAGEADVVSGLLEQRNRGLGFAEDLVQGHGFGVVQPAVHDLEPGRSRGQLVAVRDRPRMDPLEQVELRTELTDLVERLRQLELERDPGGVAFRQQHGPRGPAGWPQPPRRASP